MSQYLPSFNNLSSYIPWNRRVAQNVISESQDLTQSQQKQDYIPNTQPQPPKYVLNEETNIIHPNTQQPSSLGKRRHHNPKSIVPEISNNKDIDLEFKRRRLNTGQKHAIHDIPVTDVETVLRPIPSSQTSVQSENKTNENQQMMQGFKNLNRKNKKRSNKNLGMYPRILGDSRQRYDQPDTLMKYFTLKGTEIANGNNIDINAAIRKAQEAVNGLLAYNQELQEEGLTSLPRLSPTLVTAMNAVIGPDELKKIFSSLPNEQWQDAYNYANPVESTQVEEEKNIDIDQPPNLTQAETTYQTQPPESFQQQSQNMNIPNLTQQESIQQSQPSTFQIENVSQQPPSIQQQSQGASTLASNLSFNQSQQPPSVQQESQGASTIASNQSFPNNQQNVSQMSPPSTYNPNASIISSSGKPVLNRAIMDELFPEDKPVEQQYISQPSGTIVIPQVNESIDEDYGHQAEEKQEMLSSQQTESRPQSQNISQLSGTYGPFPANKDQQDIDITDLETDQYPDYVDPNKEYVPLKSSQTQSTIPMDTQSQQRSQTQPLSSQGSNVVNPTLPYSLTQHTEMDPGLSVHQTQPSFGMSPNLTQKDSGISANLTQADSGITDTSRTQTWSQPMSNQSTITQPSNQSTITETQPSQGSSQTTITQTPPLSSGSTTFSATVPSNISSSMGSNSTLVQSQDTNPSLASTQLYDWHPSEEEKTLQVFNNNNRSAVYRPGPYSSVTNNTGTTNTSGTSSSGQSLGTTAILSQSDYNIPQSQKQPLYPVLPTLVIPDYNYFAKRFILPPWSDSFTPQQWELDMEKQLMDWKAYNKYRADNSENTVDIPQDRINAIVEKSSAVTARRLFLKAGLNNDYWANRINMADILKQRRRGSQENTELKQSETNTGPNQGNQGNQSNQGNISMPALEQGTQMEKLEEPVKIEDVEMGLTDEEKKDELIDITLGKLKDVSKELESVWKAKTLTLKNQFPGLDIDDEKEIGQFIEDFRKKVKSMTVADMNQIPDFDIKYAQAIPELARVEIEALQEELNRIENTPNPTELDKKLRAALQHNKLVTPIKFPNLALFDKLPEDLFDPQVVKNKYKAYLESELANTFNKIPELDEDLKTFDENRETYKKYTGEYPSNDIDSEQLKAEVGFIKQNLESRKLKDIKQTNEELWKNFGDTQLENRNMTPDFFNKKIKEFQNKPTEFNQFLDQWETLKRDFLHYAIQQEGKKIMQVAEKNQIKDKFDAAYIKNGPSDKDTSTVLMNKYDYWKNLEKHPDYLRNVKTAQKENETYEKKRKEYQTLTGKPYKNVPQPTTLSGTKKRTEEIDQAIDNFNVEREKAEQTENALRKKYFEVKDKFTNLTQKLYNNDDWKNIIKYKTDPETLIKSLNVSHMKDPTHRKDVLGKHIDELTRVANLVEKSENTHYNNVIQNLQNQYQDTVKKIQRFNPNYKVINPNVGNKLEEAEKTVNKVEEEHKQLENKHAELYKEVVNFKSILDSAKAYSDGLSEKQIHDLDLDKLAQMKIKLESESNNLKVNMGAYSKNKMINFITDLQKQMKQIDPNSVPIEADAKQLETMETSKVQDLLDKEIDKHKNLEQRRQETIEKILNDVEDTHVAYNTIKRSDRFKDYQPINPDDVWNKKNLSELQNYAHQVSSYAKQGKRYADDVLAEYEEKNKAEIKKAQTQAQQQHEITMEQGRQFYGNLQADRDRNNKTFNSMLHTFDTTMNNITKATTQGNQILHEKDLEKRKQLTNLFIENKKHLLKTSELQDKKAMHLIDTNLKKSEMELKHEDVLNNQLLKVSMQEGDQIFQKELQKNKLDQETSEAKLDRDFKESLANAKNNTDVIKSLIDYDLKGNQIIKHKGIQDRKTELLKKNGDLYMERVKDMNKRGILSREQNHAKEILNIQQQFQKQQAENEQELKHIEYEEKLALDKYLNKQILKSKKELQSGEHRFKKSMHTTEQQEKSLEEQKKIQSAERYIVTVMNDLERLNIPYSVPSKLISSDDVALQLKYFGELKDTIKQVPFERKKLEQLAERADRKIPDDLKVELGLWIPHRDDINKMGYARIQEVKKELEEAFQNNKIDELELGKQRENALKLNKYIDDINSMAGDKLYPNIDLKTAPKSVEELDFAERTYKEKYEQVRNDLKLANTQKASLYTEIEEIRKELGPGSKHLIPKLTEYKNFESQKNNLYSGNLELVQKQVQELGKILREAHAAQRYDTLGKHAENSLDTYMSGLRTIAGDSTTFYKLLQNAAHGRDINQGISLDPIAAKQLIDNSRHMFEMVASNSFMKNVGRKNEHEIGLIVDSAKQMYEMSGLSKELGTKWEDIEHSLAHESPVRKAATVEMLAKSQPLSEMYLVNLAVDLKSNPTIINNENPVKLYTAMKSMGITVDMNKVKGTNSADINRQILEQIPPHLLGESTAKKIASEEEMNYASWLRQTKNVDTFSENWVGENMLTGDTQQQALRNIMSAPGYSKGAPISRLDFATGNFYPVKSTKDIKGHEAYFLNKPSDLRNIPRLKKDAILHQANALMGPFGLAYGNDKRRRAMLPYGAKPNYVHLAKFLNALPQTKTFLNNKEKLLATLHGKKRRLIPNKKVVNKHYKRRRKARMIRKKIKNKLKKKIKLPKPDEEDTGGMLVDDTDDEGGVFDYDSEVDIF